MRVISKKRVKLIDIILIVIVALLLIPYKYEVGDGGSYEAVLWRLEKHHFMWGEEELFGYNIGTIFSILWIEVYNDVVFVTDRQ